MDHGPLDGNNVAIARPQPSRSIYGAFSTLG
jgi:hypothetical protein